MAPVSKAWAVLSQWSRRSRAARGPAKGGAVTRADRRREDGARLTSGEGGAASHLPRYEELDRRMASPESGPRNHFCYNSLTISI
jgi:hypothetical protein